MHTQEMIGETWIEKVRPKYSIRLSKIIIILYMYIDACDI